jgi:hypothetical protein
LGFETSIEIDRPAEAVYGYATDPLKFSEWQPDVESVEWEGAGGRVGSRFVTKRRVPGGVQSYTQEGRSAEFTATCVGTPAFNGFYGAGIVNALGVVQ